MSIVQNIIPRKKSTINALDKTFSDNLHIRGNETILISKKRLVENIISLSFLQVVTYILPLISFPYLVRTLGVENYGILIFAQSLIQYFITLTDYGFNLTATQDISIYRENNNKISRIFSTVMCIKLILACMSLIILLTMLLLIPKFGLNWSIFLTTFLMVIGNVIFPVWFFQGMESMKYITALTVSAKVLTTLGIFIMIHGPEDILLAAGIQSSGTLIAGIMSLLLIGTVAPVKFLLPTWIEMRRSLREGCYIFISQISVTLLGNTNIFILGVFADTHQVGYFAIADKIIRAGINLSIPIVNAIYPRVSSLFSNSRQDAIRFLRKVIYLGGAFFAIESITIFLASNTLVQLFSGRANDQISHLIQIMSILPLTVFLDNIYGTQILLNIDKKKQFMYAILISGIFSLVFSLIFIPYYKAIGSALIFTLSEIILLVLLMFIVNRSNIHLFR